MIYARALNDALRSIIDADSRVVVLGEDVEDPYGGAFKVTRGLSGDFPGRVRNTPISEGAIVGVAAGLAMEGFRPIIEIMFGDFVTLCFDQIVNHVTKFQAMYNDRVTCPVIVRTPSGGGRGYGPTHSQSLEKHFLGVPHLCTVAASAYHAPQQILKKLLSQDGPVLQVEHKLLYPQPMATPESVSSQGLIFEQLGNGTALPTVAIRPVERDECRATVVAYGYQASQAADAILELAMEEELFVELLVPAQIAPVDFEPLEASVAVTGSMVTVEEGTGGWAWGAEIAYQMVSRLFGQMRRPPIVLCSEQSIIPSEKRRESVMLVNPSKMKRAIREAAK